MKTISIKQRHHRLQNIKDNVRLLDDDTLREINCVVVHAGHGLVKKSFLFSNLVWNGFVKGRNTSR